jgi:hypothetical protein
MQSNRETIVLDYKNNTEIPLDNIPNAVRTYPASAGTAMLPLTPANNWTATVIFCGGSDLQDDQYALLVAACPLLLDLFLVNFVVL